MKWLFYYVAISIRIFGGGDHRSMQRYGKQFWRSVPFIRLLIPVVAGILSQHYINIPMFFSAALAQ
jgi:hypothetical protein